MKNYVLNILTTLRGVIGLVAFSDTSFVVDIKEKLTYGRKQKIFFIIL